LERLGGHGPCQDGCRSVGVVSERRAEAHRLFAHAAFDDLVETLERATADEQDVGCVDLDEVLVWVLATALRRDVRDGALEYFQQGLLDALAGHVARYRGVVALALDLV